MDLCCACKHKHTQTWRKKKRKTKRADTKREQVYLTASVCWWRRCLSARRPTGENGEFVCVCVCVCVRVCVGKREEGSLLISCITAVISTLFITTSMCSVRFKIFKSVICQHYEVNTHPQRLVSYPSACSLLHHHHHHPPRTYITRTWCGLLSSWLEKTLRPASVISQRRQRHAAGPWRKIMGSAHSWKQKKLWLYEAQASV